MKTDCLKTRVSGFTLLESLIAVIITALILSLGIPSYQGILQRNRIKEAAESIKSDLQFARTEAIKRNTNIKVSFNKDAWCYGVNDDNTDCDCTTANDCGIKEISSAQYSDVEMNKSTNITFSFLRGTANSGRVCVSTGDYQLKVAINNLGRVKICNPPNVSEDIADYATCYANC